MSTCVLVLAACVAGSECVRRVLDGYRLATLRLVRNPNSVDLTWTSADDRSLDTLLSSIPSVAGADPAWFNERPPVATPRNPPWVDERRALGHDAGANYIWNAASLDEPAELAYFSSVLPSLDEVFTFGAPGNLPRPRYRLYPGIQTGFGVTNRFGWKSGDIELAKPPDVIRIAMLGDSTTGGYPRLVEHWLNLWAGQSHLGVRFEIIDASRPATDALDAAAIFELEVRPFDPDYVIVYGFGNAIASAEAIAPVPSPLRRGQPSSANLRASRFGNWPRAVSARLEPLTPWSAAALFLQRRIAGERGDALAPEPSKPPTEVRFPPDIDENNPDPDAVSRHAGVMGLDAYLRALNRIDALAKPLGTRVFVSTFRVLARDGMLLPKGGSDALLYRTLNEQYWWPYTYGEIRRVVSFYNRTLRAWADRTGNGLIPIDEQMPWRRELYVDGMHEVALGEALHAWIVLQRLMPEVRHDLGARRLPRQSVAAAKGFSDEYWAIRRTKTADAVASANARNALTRARPFDEIPRAFDLSKVAVAGPGASVTSSSAPRITTSTAPYAYAAAVPIEPAVAAALGGKGWVRVRIKAVDGRLSIGVLNKSGRRFLASGSVAAAPEVQQLQLDVDDLADAGSVVISNDRGDGKAAAVGELYAVVLARLRE